MARAESKMVMGYLPIDLKHYAAILSLIVPAQPAVRLLDPFAGEGAFLEAAAKAASIECQTAERELDDPANPASEGTTPQG